MTEQEIDEQVARILADRGWPEPDISRTIQNRFAPYDHIRGLVMAELEKEKE